MIIFKSKNMQPIDYAYEIIRMTDNLKRIYKEDFHLILSSLGLSTNKVESLNFTKNEFLKLQTFHSSQFDPHKRINQPWLDRFIGEIRSVN